jgi:hypothetical protein
LERDQALRPLHARFRIVADGAATARLLLRELKDPERKSLTGPDGPLRLRRPKLRESGSLRFVPARCPSRPSQAGRRPRSGRLLPGDCERGPSARSSWSWTIPMSPMRSRDTRRREEQSDRAGVDRRTLETGRFHKRRMTPAIRSRPLPSSSVLASGRISASDPAVPAVGKERDCRRARVETCVHAGVGTHQRRHSRGCVSSESSRATPAARLLLSCLQNPSAWVALGRVELGRGALAGLVLATRGGGSVRVRASTLAS